MKPIDVTSDSSTQYNEDINKEDHKFKVTVTEFQIIKTFLLKDILQIGQNKFFFISTIKNTVPWTYVINDLNG